MMWKEVVVPCLLANPLLKQNFITDYYERVTKLPYFIRTARIDLLP
jgi:hypothetical protein